MAILIGCEESQTITAKFRQAGFTAFSCDLLPTRGRPEWHIQDDIMGVIPTRQWDLIILHPDCTALALCGNSTYGRNMPKHQQRIEAIDWTIKLWELAKQHSFRVALENPASVIFQHLGKTGMQFVQPYQFGHMEQKKTGLALHNLPELASTNDVYVDMMLLPKAQRERIHYMGPSKTRKRDRSKTFDGIANAIVNQWSVNHD